MEDLPKIVKTREDNSFGENPSVHVWIYSLVVLTMGRRLTDHQYDVTYLQMSIVLCFSDSLSPPLLHTHTA